MIRHARASDRDAIDVVIAAAFDRPDEAELVRRLRAAEDSIFELVAEADGEVVGHVMFSRLWADRGELYSALAPLAVHPRLQRTGLGSALVRQGLETARDFAAVGVLVLGDPAYYGRFGFTAEAARQVNSPFSGLAGFQALALEASAFRAAMSVAYPDGFASAPADPL